MRPELAVEIVEHDAGLDAAASAGHIEIEHAIEMLRAVDHQRIVDRLSGLRESRRRARARLTPSSRASAIARSASPIVFGVTTPSGMIW